MLRPRFPGSPLSLLWPTKLPVLSPRAQMLAQPSSIAHHSLLPALARRVLPPGCQHPGLPGTLTPPSPCAASADSFPAPWSFPLEGLDCPFPFFLSSKKGDPLAG